MSSLYNVNAPKKPTNLTINTDLLNKAKDMNINISSILEIALANVVKQKKREKWVDENRNAINAYNKHVDQFGLFSDELRTF
jgi:antitoxin CcdA